MNLYCSGSCKESNIIDLCSSFWRGTNKHFYVYPFLKFKLKISL